MVGVTITGTGAGAGVTGASTGAGAPEGETRAAAFPTAPVEGAELVWDEAVLDTDWAENTADSAAMEVGVITTSSQVY